MSASATARQGALASRQPLPPRAYRHVAARSQLKYPDLYIGLAHRASMEPRSFKRGNERHNAATR